MSILKSMADMMPSPNSSWMCSCNGPTAAKCTFRDNNLDNTASVLADDWVPAIAYGGGFQRIVLAGADSAIDLGGGDIVVLIGVSLQSLTAADFLLAGSG